jgi:hypothetical protein
MKPILHIAAAILATSTIAVFLLATLLVELFGSPGAIAAVKRAIVLPGLLLLVPAIAATGASGFLLSHSRRGPLVDAKKRRMPVIAANGLLVLVPCAIALDAWAAQGLIDARFYALQCLELAAGAVNLALMLMNVRDGLRLGGRRRGPDPILR